MGLGLGLGGWLLGRRPAAAAWELPTGRRGGAERQAGSGWGLPDDWIHGLLASRLLAARRRRRAASLEGGPAEQRRRAGHSSDATARLAGAEWGAVELLLGLVWAGPLRPRPTTRLLLPSPKKPAPHAAPPPSCPFGSNSGGLQGVGIWCLAKGPRAAALACPMRLCLGFGF
jgi:hypothetical protein